MKLIKCKNKQSCLNQILSFPTKKKARSGKCIGKTPKNLKPGDGNSKTNSKKFLILKLKQRLFDLTARKGAFNLHCNTTFSNRVVKYYNEIQELEKPPTENLTVGQYFKKYLNNELK